MGDFLTDLKAFEIALGLLVTMIGVVGGGLAWWDRRNKRYLDTKTEGFNKSSLSQANRLDRVEQRLGEIEGDIDQLGTKTTAIESRLETLATSRELSEVNARLAAVQAHMDASSTTLRMLYEAAMRADSSRGKA